MRKRRSWLSSSAYPQANPDYWLIYRLPWQNKIDPVFARRLAALARSHKKKIFIFSGFRSHDEQMYYFKLHGRPRAQKPGSSWHEFGGAADTTTLWLRNLDNFPLEKQYELARFGLCKPLTKGNRFYPPEDWHLQPIELARYNSLKLKRMFYRAYR